MLKKSEITKIKRKMRPKALLLFP
ncbi:MAG: hypothetical protein PHX09_04315 [Clostridia bacterium]|nr:hypothetical protein [Clostridia bacterium]